MTGNLKRNAKACLLLLAVAIVLVLTFIGKHNSQQARIAERATQNGYALAGEVRHPFLEPTPFWLSGKHDDVLKVEVVDDHGNKRTCWFRFRLFGMDQAWPSILPRLGCSRV